MSNEDTESSADSNIATQGLLIPEPSGVATDAVEQSGDVVAADQSVAPPLPVPLAADVAPPQVKVPQVKVPAVKPRPKVRAVLTRDSWLGEVGEVVLLDAVVADAAEEMGAIDSHPEAVKDAYKTRARR